MTDRPTKRERRDLARKGKLEAQRRRNRKRRKQRLMSALMALVAIGAIGLVIKAGRQSQKDLQAKLTAAVADAGCLPVETHEDELKPGTPHLTPPATVSPKTNPAASGPHYGVQPVTGVFSAPRQTELWLHNLEHGHVGVLYKPDIDPAVKAALEGSVRARSTLMFMTSSTTIPESLDLVGWTKILRCPAPKDAKKIKAVAELFFDTKPGSAAPEATIAGSPSAG